MKIQFKDTYTVKAAGGATYLKGSAYDLPPSSAAHFINRGLAVPLVEPAIEPPAVKEPEPPPDPVIAVDPEIVPDDRPRGRRPTRNTRESQK